MRLANRRINHDRRQLTRAAAASSDTDCSTGCHSAGTRDYASALMASTLRGATKRFLVRTGNEALLEAYRVWRTPYDAKRDARDIANIKLLITACLRHDSNAIDIGANRGLILRSIVHRAPNGHHVAFEPLPWIAEQLRKKFPNVEIHEMALADETGEARFRFVPKDPALSALPSGKAIDPMFRIEQLTVRVGRLDDVLPRDYHPHFIKIDVEGAEDEVIRGLSIRCVDRNRWSCSSTAPGAKGQTKPTNC